MANQVVIDEQTMEAIKAEGRREYYRGIYERNKEKRLEYLRNRYLNDEEYREKRLVKRREYYQRNKQKVLKAKQIKQTTLDNSK